MAQRPLVSREYFCLGTVRKPRFGFGSDSQKNGLFELCCALSHFASGQFRRTFARPSSTRTAAPADRDATPDMRLILTASLLVLATRVQVGGGGARGGRESMGHDCFLPKHENKKKWWTPLGRLFPCRQARPGKKKTNPATMFMH